jgi:hypothetical protein
MAAAANLLSGLQKTCWLLDVEGSSQLCLGLVSSFELELIVDFVYFICFVVGFNPEVRKNDKHSTVNFTLYC